VSRGIGRTQRVALLALWQTRAELEEERDAGIPLTALKRRISSDRSNARRAIRNLMERGMVEEITSEAEGERRVKLTSGGHGALTLASVFCDPGEGLTEDDVPSKPFDFDTLYRDAEDLAEQEPLGSEQPSWTTADDPDLPVSDNGRPHAGRDTPCRIAADLESSVNDNAIKRALTWLEEGL
jgi:DNA-binding MarR family transcriptional regulator